MNHEREARVKSAISAHGKGQPVDEMAKRRIGDNEGFEDYQREVFSWTQAPLESMDPNDLLRVVIARPSSPEVATTYNARCAGDAGITVLDAFECWHYQHSLRHMGEIESRVDDVEPAPFPEGSLAGRRDQSDPVYGG